VEQGGGDGGRDVGRTGSDGRGACLEVALDGVALGHRVEVGGDEGGVAEVGELAVDVVRAGEACRGHLHRLGGGGVGRHRGLVTGVVGHLGPDHPPPPVHLPRRERAGREHVHPPPHVPDTGPQLTGVGVGRGPDVGGVGDVGQGCLEIGARLSGEHPRGGGVELGERALHRRGTATHVEPGRHRRGGGRGAVGRRGRGGRLGGLVGGGAGGVLEDGQLGELGSFLGSDGLLRAERLEARALLVGHR
jgi:hypothetical protein